MKVVALVAVLLLVPIIFAAAQIKVTGIAYNPPEIQEDEQFALFVTTDSRLPISSVACGISNEDSNQKWAANALECSCSPVYQNQLGGFRCDFTPETGKVLGLRYLVQYSNARGEQGLYAMNFQQGQKVSIFGIFEVKKKNMPYFYVSVFFVAFVSFSVIFYLSKKLFVSEQNQEGTFHLPEN